MTLLDIKQVSLKFPNTPHFTLKDINYTIYPGDFIILLGSNGSGKSSLLKLIYQQYHPTAGRLLFLNKLLSHYSHKSLSREINVLTQNTLESFYPNLTVYENYKMQYKQRQNGESFLKSYLNDFNPNLSQKLHLTIHQLSGGERQALALALCLLKPPSLLLLDEHTSALDPNTSNQLMQLTDKQIKSHHITCLLTTHDLDIALNYGNRILILNNGRIYKTFDADEKAKLTKQDLILYYA